MINRKLSLRKSALIVLSAMSLSAFAVGAKAANLVTNGSFESTTAGLGQLGSNTNATGWSSTGYGFLFTPGSADTTGAFSPLFSAFVKLWGPGTGSANGLPATSPDGGNYVALDGDATVAGASSVSQTLTGLTVGQPYAVSFYTAAAQQFGFTGTTTEGLTVGFGGATQNLDITTAANPLPSKGFSGWTKETLSFTATSSSATLSFLAYGTPTGAPPFSLLDGVSVTAVPEAPIFSLNTIFVLGLGAGLRWKFARKK
jgi:hypothetical protein